MSLETRRGHGRNLSALSLRLPGLVARNIDLSQAMSRHLSRDSSQGLSQTLLHVGATGVSRATPLEMPNGPWECRGLFNFLLRGTHERSKNKTDLRPLFDARRRCRVVLVHRVTASWRDIPRAPRRGAIRYGRCCLGRRIAPSHFCGHQHRPRIGLFAHRAAG